MNLETASENIRTMGGAVKASTIPGKHTEGSIESEVFYVGSNRAS